MPKPTKVVARFVMATEGSISVLTLASGDSVRASRWYQPMSTMTPKAIRPSVRGSPHPHDEACEMASSGPTSPTARTTAPRMSTLPGVRTGDSGMKSCVASAATAAMPAPIQKSTW